MLKFEVVTPSVPVTLSVTGTDETTPLSVAVTRGFVTVSVRMAVPMLMVPFKVRLLRETPAGFVPLL